MYTLKNKGSLLPFVVPCRTKFNIHFCIRFKVLYSGKNYFLNILHTKKRKVLKRTKNGFSLAAPYWNPFLRE